MGLQLPKLAAQGIPIAATTTIGDTEAEEAIAGGREAAAGIDGGMAEAVAHHDCDGAPAIELYVACWCIASMQ